MSHALAESAIAALLHEAMSISTDRAMGRNHAKPERTCSSNKSPRRSFRKYRNRHVSQRDYQGLDMSDLQHQHQVHAFNRAHFAAAENEHMAELERRSSPLFYAVYGLIAVFVAWTVTADYRNVLQHRLDTYMDLREAKIINAKLASCANKEVVEFDGHLMTCKIDTKTLVVMQ